MRSRLVALSFTTGMLDCAGRGWDRLVRWVLQCLSQFTTCADHSYSSNIERKAPLFFVLLLCCFVYSLRFLLSLFLSVSVRARVRRTEHVSTTCFFTRPKEV